VLEYSRIGHENNVRAPVELNQLVAQIIQDVVPADRARVIVENPLPTLNIDPVRIHQVFQNLIDNAVKYMDKPQGEIHISCQRELEYWVFCVQDNGPGIAPRYFERIFQMFQTLTPRDQFESTGIGLTLVKRIMELYNGKIWVTATVGEGSTFHFSLPASMTV
jgi:signal transduction histidine kinase